MHRLEIAGMKKYFDYIFVSERIGASKPSKVFFERAFAELNAGRKEMILPEDRPLGWRFVCSGGKREWIYRMVYGGWIGWRR